MHNIFLSLTHFMNMNSLIVNHDCMNEPISLFDMFLRFYVQINVLKLNCFECI